MEFSFTPEEAQPAALKLIDRLKRDGGTLSVEQAAWDDAPYRTTIVHVVHGMSMLYEVQGHLDFHERLKAFSDWMAARRHFAELYLVAEAEGEVAAVAFRDLSRQGVGLILNENGRFDTALRPRNPAFQVTPEPTLKFGDLKPQMTQCIEKFNAGARKDGLRDLCELVERETEQVLVRASRRGWVRLSERQIRAKDWSEQIDALASKNVMNTGKDTLVDTKLKDDLHSFRGSRNLFDHKVTSKRADLRRQRQAVERMMMGPRILSDLMTIKRRIA